MFVFLAAATWTRFIPRIFHFDASNRHVRIFLHEFFDAAWLFKDSQFFLKLSCLVFHLGVPSPSIKIDSIF